MEEGRGSFSSVLVDRRWELYGPGRAGGREAAKRLQQEDHVKRNFQKGVLQPDSKAAFETVTARSFKPAPGKLGELRSTAKWDPSTQNVTHLHFGSDSEPYTSVVQTEFTSKPVPKYEHHLPEGINDIHLADMAPKYMADKSFGKSLYNTDFDGADSYRQWSSHMTEEGRKVGRRLKTTQFQKATHFELGSDNPSLLSETSQCFTSGEHCQAPSSGEGVDRSRSNVFRPGDYNSPRRVDNHFLSVQQQDFGSGPSPSAGVNTATKKGYSHVIPRKPAPMQAISALRQLLIDKNSTEFVNPRDPVAINVMQAFLKYDQDRSGSVSVEELRAVCRELGSPITDEEVAELLKECDVNGDGMIDYTEFSKYLTDQSAPPGGGSFVSTHGAAYPSSRPPTGSSSAEREPFMGVQYQTSTHFQFGNDKEANASVYKNDYDTSERMEQSTKPQAAPPLSSKVMHEYPVFRTAGSTNRGDFPQHDIAGLEGQRLAHLQANKGRLEKLGVVLSSSQPGPGKECHHSTMSVSYGSPPAGLDRSQPVDPVPKDFHHLESNRALPQSKPHEANTDTSTASVRGQGRSEAKESFAVPIASEHECVEKRRNALNERTSRINDSKHTHFFLGFSEQPACSEKMAEFGEKAPLNPSLPAAGKPNGPTKGYSVVDHDCGASTDDSRPVSSSEGGSAGLQGLLQQRNFTRNVNPRDPLNVNLKKAFLEYDKDLSGTISADEVRAVCKAMDTAASDAELEELIAGCDKDGAGHIDYHDFALHLSQQHPPAHASSGRTAAPTSTTRKDFKHPGKQQLTAMQRLVLEQDSRRYVPLQQTHFFHLDSGEEYNVSTTTKDFVPPEQL